MSISLRRRQRQGRRTHRRRSDLGGEAGFTLLEVVMAAVVLVVGLLGLFGLLDISVKASASTRAREGATNLARELLEDARTIPYSQLAPSSIVGQLQAMPGLANTTPGPIWHVARRGVTYTVTVSECSIDDPKDGYGVHDSTFCQDPSEKEGTQDSTPADLKRITVDVTWVARGRAPDVHQVETLTAAGETVGLSASELKLASTSPPVKESGSATAPTITEPVEKLTFSVSSPVGTAAMSWSLDGTAQTPAPTLEGGTKWTFTWQPITGLSDGTYQVSAQAIDATGVAGPPVSIAVTLIRGLPAAPKGLKGGFNTVNVSGTPTKVAELQWLANSERNVIGYRVFKGGGKEACPGGGELSTATSCIDFTPPKPTGTESERTYSFVALYRDAKGVVREGLAASLTLATGPPPGPNAPTGLTIAHNADGSVTLTWKAPTGGPEVTSYRIYRGSTNYTSRYDTAATTTYTDTDAVISHEYWVTAVSANLTESPFLGPGSG